MKNINYEKIVLSTNYVLSTNSSLIIFFFNVDKYNTSEIYELKKIIQK